MPLICFLHQMTRENTRIYDNRIKYGRQSSISLYCTCTRHAMLGLLIFVCASQIGTADFFHIHSQEDFPFKRKTNKKKQKLQKNVISPRKPKNRRASRIFSKNYTMTNLLISVQRCRIVLQLLTAMNPNLRMVLLIHDQRFVTYSCKCEKQ